MLEYLKFGTYVKKHLFSENIPFGTKAVLILLMSAFFAKKSAFFRKNRTFTQSNSVKDILVVFSFCKRKGYSLWKCKFYRLCVRNSAFGLLQIGHKSGKWQWRHNLTTWRHRNFFWHCFVFLVTFSYWFKFYINIITDSGVTTIYFYKRLTRTLTDIWTLGRIMDTKFGTDVSNKLFLLLREN